MSAHAVRIRACACALAAAVLVCAPAFAQQDRTTVDIEVDVARTVSESGGNDLDALRRIFQSASAPEANGGLEPAWPVAARLGMRAMRIINDAGECRLDMVGRIDGCQRLQGNLHWVRRYRLVPHVIVGQTKPPHMPTPGASWGEAEWAQYETFAAKLVRWVMLNQGVGFREAIFEVGNETDITGDAKELWTLAKTDVPAGHAARYAHYFRVYRAWARAVALVAAAFPEKRLHVAGPAMGGQGLFLSGGTMYHEHFLAQVAREDLRLDLLTLHFYGDFVRGWPQAPRSDLRTQLARMRDAARKAGRADVPIHITEWAASEDTRAPINANAAGGAWAAAFLVEAFAGGARGGSYWLVRDAIGADPNGIVGIGSYTHVREGRDQPKPQANVFALFNMLPGERRAVRAPAALRALAGADDESVGVIASNHGWNFWTDRDESAPRNVRIVVRGMPRDGPVVAERFVIDGTPRGAPTDAPRAVETINARATRGTVTLPARELGRASVSFWRVTVAER